uniref:LysR family transcriptional regulator n=1 Tax=Acidicaldus sp. TaxID=1872105 RepID=A0A8J4HBZ8_9PROT
MLEWDGLRSFLAIVRHGTLSAAARAMGVRQSTMGRRLAALEAQAGAKLLQKTRTGYTLTQAGAIARDQAELMEAAALTAERAIAGQDTRLEGEVRLTTVESLGAEIVVPVLARLAETHPGILVSLITEMRTLNLAAREADLALRLARPRGQALVIRKLAEIGWGIYASPAYLAHFGTPSDGGAGHRLILMEEDSPAFPEIVHLAETYPLAEPALRGNSRYVHLSACKAGLGIAVLAHYLARSLDLVRLSGSVPSPSRELWLAQHRDTRNTPRIRVVAEALAAGIRLAAPRLANPA